MPQGVDPGRRLILITYEECYGDEHVLAEGGGDCHFTWEFYVSMFFLAVAVAVLLFGYFFATSMKAKQAVTVTRADGEEQGEKEEEILKAVRVPVGDASLLAPAEVAATADRLRTYGVVVLCPAAEWADHQPAFVKGATAAQRKTRAQARLAAKSGMYEAMQAYCGAWTAADRPNPTGVCAFAHNEQFLTGVYRFGTSAGNAGADVSFRWILQLEQGEVMLLRNAAVTGRQGKGAGVQPACVKYGILPTFSIEKNTSNKPAGTFCNFDASTQSTLGKALQAAEGCRS